MTQATTHNTPRRAHPAAARAALRSLNISTLGYDAAGKLLAVTEPYGAKTSYACDNSGRRTPCGCRSK